jgi:hypothetical protein
MKRMALFIAITIMAGACASPEAARTRGGGRGADVNNRPASVKLHEGSRPYWKTPVRISGESAGSPIDASEQAHRLAVPGGNKK